MATVKAPLKLRIKASAHGVQWVFRKPLYATLAIILGFLFSGFISSLLNYETVVLFTFELPLPVSERLSVLWDIFTDIYRTYPLNEAIGALMLSYLFGLVASLMIYILRHNKSEKVSGKSSSIGALFGAVSAGCAACGTSLLAPVLTAIGVTSTASALRFGFFLNLIGSVMLLYSIYKLGLVCATLKQKQLTDT